MDIKEQLKDLQESIDKEIEIRDNTIRNLREDIKFRDKIITKLAKKLGIKL